jgi:hypothetical protein
MTYGVYACGERSPRRNHSFAITANGLFRSLVPALGAVVAVGMLYAHTAVMQDDVAIAPAGDPANVAVATRWPDVFDNIYDPLRDPNVSLGAPPATFAERLPPSMTFHAAGTADAAIDPAPKPQSQPTVTMAVVETVPMPKARPSEPHIIANRGPTHNAPLTTATVLASAPPDQRNFLEKFFGLNKPAAGPQLAYASPDGGLSGVPMADTPAHLGSDDHTTAVYDISAHTVYMPDGRRLEAHSGLGPSLDDPRRVAEHMRGPTPPHVYALKLRESLFHGVRALRLTPVGDGDVYGRSGLLAHTYMLGPNGDSNGCVSFKDYDAFVRAYDNGEVKHLVVVSHLS